MGSIVTVVAVENESGVAGALDFVTLGLSIIAVLLSIPAIVYGYRANRRAAGAEKREAHRHDEEFGPEVDAIFENGHVILLLRGGEPAEWMAAMDGEGTGSDGSSVRDFRATFEEHNQVTEQFPTAGPLMAFNRWWTPGDRWVLPAIRPAPHDRTLGFSLTCRRPRPHTVWVRTIYVKVPGQLTAGGDS